MTNRWRKTTYEAIGFVEALIAILLVGMSSLVLLQIAINTLNTAIQNEVIDHMTQYAMEGGEMVQDIYNKQKMKGYPEEEDPEESELFFPLLEDGEDEEGNCFVINKARGEVFFKKDEAGSFVRYKKENRGSYRHEALIDLEDFAFEYTGLGNSTNYVNINNQFFRVICLEGSIEGEKPFIIARVIVGQRYFDEELFEDEKLYSNFVRDYEYLTVVKL